jgi:hypothetical protein
VAAKFAITLTQLSLGIFLLSSALDATVASARAGRQGPTAAVLVGGVLMAGAIGFQAWLSIAKPWRRTPWSRARSGAQGPTWLFVVAVLVPVADYGLGVLVGSQPTPLLSVLTILGVCAWQLRLAIRVPPSNAGGSVRVAGHREGDARNGTAESSSSEPGTQATLG